MNNKINFVVNPVAWHEWGVNRVDRCAKVKQARFVKQVSSNALTMGTGTIAGIAQVAKFIFVQPVGMALTVTIGLVRVLTWSNCLSRAYRALPGPKDWLMTAGKIVAYTIGLPVSALATLGSFIGSNPSRLHVRYQKKFVLTPLQPKVKILTPASKQGPQKRNPVAPVSPNAQGVNAQRAANLNAQPGYQPQQAPAGGNPNALPGNQQLAPAGGNPNALPGNQQLAPAGGNPNALPGNQQLAPAGGNPNALPGNQQQAPAGGNPNAQPVPQPEIIEQLARGIVPVATAYAGVYAFGKGVSALGHGLAYGASMAQSVAGKALSLLSSAFTKSISAAIPNGVKNVTLANAAQSSIINPLVANSIAFAVPYLAQAAVGVAKMTAPQVAQTHLPLVTSFLNATLPS